MTTLQDQPQVRSSTTTTSRARAQAGDIAETLQSQQQSRDGGRQQADREQSGQQEETFTISVDDWFKA